MAEWAAQPRRGPWGAQGQGLRLVVLPWRPRASRGLGSRVTPERLCAWRPPATPRPANTGGPGGTRGLPGRPRSLVVAGRPGRWGSPLSRSPGPGPGRSLWAPPGPWARLPPLRRPAGFAVPTPPTRLRSRPPAALSVPHCRKAEAEGRPPSRQPRTRRRWGLGAAHQERTPGRTQGPSARTYLTGIWIQKYLFLKLKSSQLEGIEQQVNYLEIPVEQLTPEPNLLAHTQKSTQNNKQGIFQLWNCALNEGGTIEKREFKKSSVETGFNVTTNPIRLFTLSHPFPSTSADEQVGPYPGLPVPLGLCWPHADGDFFKNRNEIQFSSCSAIENDDGETLPAPNWNLKHGSSSVEENLTDESDLSENEIANDTLLSSFKKVDLNLKPETIKNVEEPFTEEPNEVFPYPDFLPPAFSTLDLHNLALSKSDNWKATVEPAESSIEHLITRLLELERLQHMTIQKERPRLPATFCTPAVPERPSSSKATPKARQLKLCDSLSLQIPCVDKSQERSKNNSGSCKLEQNALKWNWSNAGKYKWNTRPPPLKSFSTTKQLIETYKNPKSYILNPCQELSSKPTTGQTTQSLVKMVSTRCLPSRSPMPVSPIPLSFPENQKEEIKAPKRNFGTKKKLYRQNTVLNRPFSMQKLNCLSPSLIAKDKCCSPIEQK
ncbi:protein FAM217A isoform X1 [Chlorocebus sabaeus]|uniref:protein FAM217A isoform X1 n=1 Tax=Chlorocebus sabaeus TaxID=60711 RepID=UPI003BFA38D5